MIAGMVYLFFMLDMLTMCKIVRVMNSGKSQVLYFETSGLPRHRLCIEIVL